MERFTIIVEPIPGWRVPGVVRLRRALKVMLRAFGLRCIGLMGDGGIDSGKTEQSSL